jgi:hypothetical protein
MIPSPAEVPFLDGRVVEVVEIVQTQDGVPLVKETLGVMGGDESGSAGQEHMHSGIGFR